MNREEGSGWREHARAVIERVTRETGTADLEALEKEIRAAYPFGVREHWPYKVWNDEVRKAMARLRAGDAEHQAPLFGGPA